VTLFEIVALYVALNLILAPILMFRVGQVRQSEKVSIGNGQSPELASLAPFWLFSAFLAWPFIFFLKY